MSSHKITIRDIARECGVSVATVSRVINQNGRFSKETEQRVRETIDRHHYQPNQLAKGLRASKTDAIGIIVPDIANEFFANIILTMQTTFFESGYATIIYNTSGSIDMERQCHSMLSTQGVAGIVSANSLEDVRTALRRPVPTVYVDRFLKDNELGGKVASITSDNLKGGRLAAQELVASGCRRPITVTAMANAPTTKMRTDGFKMGLAKLGFELDSRGTLTPISTTFQEGKALVERLVANGAEFDGIFCQTDRLAMGALEALRNLHIRVPDEVAVVGYDDIMIARFGRPPLTTIHQDSQRIGREATELMLSMIKGKSPQERCVTIPVGLIRRESTKRLS